MCLLRVYLFDIANGSAVHIKVKAISLFFVDTQIIGRRRERLIFGFLLNWLRPNNGKGNFSELRRNNSIVFGIVANA